MSCRVPPLTYPRTPSSIRDRKGSFRTRPTGNVPGYKSVINRPNCLQQPAWWHNTSKVVVACLGGGESRSAPEKNHRKLVLNRQTRVDITKHKCSAHIQCVYIVKIKCKTAPPIAVVGVDQPMKALL